MCFHLPEALKTEGRETDRERQTKEGHGGGGRGWRREGYSSGSRLAYCYRDRVVFLSLCCCYTLHRACLFINKFLSGKHLFKGGV